MQLECYNRLKNFEVNLVKKSRNNEIISFCGMRYPVPEVHTHLHGKPRTNLEI